MLTRMDERDKILVVFSTLIIALCGEHASAGENLAKTGLVFTVKEAQKVLKCCCTVRSSCNTEVSTRIKISPVRSQTLLQKLVALRLLYPATAIIMTGLSSNTKLRPSAKGLAFVHRYSLENGALTGPVCQLLQSLYNTMSLVELPRDSNGSLKVSTGFVFVLWQKTMGTRPCKYPSEEGISHVMAPGYHNVAGKYSEKLAEFAIDGGRDRKGPSPHWHKFFSHPNSNAVSQYWDSKSGVRVFGKLKFRHKPKSSKSSVTVTRDLCVSGKALWQWIMECTDTLCFKECMSIVCLFVSNRLVRPVVDDVMETVCFSDDMPLVVSRTTLYDITPKGRWVADWQGEDHDGEIQLGPLMSSHLCVYPAELSQASSISPSDLKLTELLEIYFTETDVADDFQAVAAPQVVLAEPGLYMLFKEWLTERHCTEPLSFLESCTELNRLVALWRASEDYSSHVASHSWQALCRLMFQFVSEGAPSELNISACERQKIIEAFQMVDYVNTESISSCVDAMEAALQPVIAKQQEIVAQKATQFVSTARIIPALKAYVTKQQMYYAVNALAAELTVAH